RAWLGRPRGVRVWWPYRRMALGRAVILAARRADFCRTTKRTRARGNARPQPGAASDHACAGRVPSEAVLAPAQLREHGHVVGVLHAEVPANRRVVRAQERV